MGFVPVWDNDAIDGLTEGALTRLLVEGWPARRVAVEIAQHMAQKRPDLPALALALPLSMAAASIDELLGGGQPARDIAQDTWRVAALVGTEALALRVAGSDSIVDLLARWGDTDSLFTP